MLLNTDVDECVGSNGGCAHVCNNTEGSFSCGCNEGYLLNSDETSCDGKNIQSHDNSSNFSVLLFRC